MRLLTVRENLPHVRRTHHGMHGKIRGHIVGVLAWEAERSHAQACKPD